MALKITPRKSPNVTTPEDVSVPSTSVDLASILPPSLVQLSFSPAYEDLLPQLKMVWPIEIGGSNPFTMADVYHVGIYNGAVFKPLKAPYTLSVLAGRNAARLTIESEGGKKYNRAFAPLGKGASAEAFSAMMSDPHAQKGFSFVLAVFANGEAALVQFDVLGVMGDYWGRPLGQATTMNKLGMAVMIEDHSGNLKASKRDPLKKYLDPKKFNQYSLVDLTEQQLEVIPPLIRDSEALFQRWLDL